MPVEKRSISAQRELLAQADTRWKELGYPNWSRYVQFLIEQDVRSNADHVRTARKIGRYPPARPERVEMNEASSSGAKAIVERVAAADKKREGGGRGR